MSAVPAHDSVGTVQKNCVDFFAQTNFANVLVIFFLYFQYLGQFSHLLLQPLDFLLHGDLLSSICDLLI